MQGGCEHKKARQLSFRYDHRVVDGKEAMAFLPRAKDCIESPARMLVGASWDQGLMASSQHGDGKMPSLLDHPSASSITFSFASFSSQSVFRC